MRILFCTDTFPPQVNGVSVVTALTIRGLQARGWECAAIAPRLGPRQRLEIDGGVAPANAAACREAGCDVLVAANSIFGAPDRRSAIRGLRGEAPLS